MDPLFLWLDALADLDPYTRLILITALQTAGLLGLLFVGFRIVDRWIVAQQAEQARREDLEWRVRRDYEARIHRSVTEARRLHEQHVTSKEKAALLDFPDRRVS